jgi:hypothetical protein
MERDKLFVLRPEFADPAFPDDRFFCWHCALLEGVIVSFPQLAQRIDIERIDWAKPRHKVVAMIGECNQSCPVLILANDSPLELATGEWNGIRFVKGQNEILHALAVRHGIALPHP